MYFRGRPGHTYQFRLRARDRLRQLQPVRYDQTAVPLDDRSRRLRFSSGWTRSTSRRAYRRNAAEGPGCPAPRWPCASSGTRVALVAPRSFAGGRVRVTVAGRTRVVSLRGDAIARRVVFRSRVMRPGVHRIRVVSVGGGPVAVDAVAVEQGPRRSRGAGR